uniref:Uncharacterized protein n=1 Tax=Plectus sambesii TaxID=2011161 RepID=A0A914WJF6_9BILA
MKVVRSHRACAHPPSDRRRSPATGHSVIGEISRSAPCPPAIAHCPFPRANDSATRWLIGRPVTLNEAKTVQTLTSASPRPAEHTWCLRVYSHF